MTEKEFKELMTRYTNGTASPEEKRAAEKLFDSYYQDARTQEFDPIGDSKEREERILQAIYSQYQQTNPRTRTGWQWLGRVAASILVTIVIGAVYYSIQRKTQSAQGIVKDQSGRYKNDIAPGGNKAILTLADGSDVSLTDAQKGSVAEQGNATVTKTEDGRVSYEISGNEVAASQVAYNIVTTPRGGQYQLTLSDGSKIWLNASSSIRFPVSFAGNERIVELKGEAYFEIAHDASKPFIVQADNLNVNVLGTHFNVMAYPNELNVRTTLLEGAINISTAATSGHAGVTLKPGQQGVFNQRMRSINVLEVDPDESVAWKNGYFQFAHEDVASIMRKIERWYDVEVVYEGDVQHKVFAGSMSRFENVSQMLHLMELTGEVHFEIDQKKIIVRPYDNKEKKERNSRRRRQ